MGYTKPGLAWIRTQVLLVVTLFGPCLRLELAYLDLLASLEGPSRVPWIDIHQYHASLEYTGPYLGYNRCQLTTLNFYGCWNGT